MADMTSIGPKVEMLGTCFLSRGSKLLGSQNAIKAIADFDLITWLVIKNAQ